MRLASNRVSATRDSVLTSRAPIRSARERDVREGGLSARHLSRMAWIDLRASSALTASFLMRHLSGFAAKKAVLILAFLPSLPHLSSR